MRPWIQTRAGVAFDLLDPHPDMVCLEDIAWSLAHQCRYTGHTSAHYSVAQHSVWVSEHVPDEHAFAGLMHDAAEAYVGDVAKPLKSLLPHYRDIELGVWTAVCAKFGLDLDLPDVVKHADMVALATEKRDLMMTPPQSWGTLPDPDPYGIWPWPSVSVARRRFLDRFAATCPGPVMDAIG